MLPIFLLSFLILWLYTTKNQQKVSDLSSEEFIQLESEISTLDKSESYREVQDDSLRIRQSLSDVGIVDEFNEQYNQKAIEKIGQFSDEKIKNELLNFYLITKKTNNTKSSQMTSYKKFSEQLLQLRADQKMQLFEFLSKNLDSLGASFINDFKQMWLLENPKMELAKLGILYIQDLQADSLDLSQNIAFFDAVELVAVNESRESSEERLIEILEKTQSHPQMFYQAIEIFKKYHPELTDESINQMLIEKNIAKPLVPEN